MRVVLSNNPLAPSFDPVSGGQGSALTTGRLIGTISLPDGVTGTLRCG